MCRKFVGNFEISKFLSGINLNLGPKMREFGRFLSGHTLRSGPWTVTQFKIHICILINFKEGGRGVEDG